MGNAGRSFGNARNEAQFCANRTMTPRYMHLWNGVWWIEKAPCDDSMEILPKKDGGDEMSHELFNTQALAEAMRNKAANPQQQPFTLTQDAQGIMCHLWFFRVQLPVGGLLMNMQQELSLCKALNHAWDMQESYRHVTSSGTWIFPMTNPFAFYKERL